MTTVLKEGGIPQGSPLCYAWGKVKENDALILFDSGSTHNYISVGLASKLEIHAHEMGETHAVEGPFEGPDTPINPLIGKLRLHVQGYVDKEDFLILALKNEDVLLGVPWLDRMAASLKFPQRKVTFKYNGPYSLLRFVLYNTWCSCFIPSPFGQFFTSGAVECKKEPSALEEAKAFQEYFLRRQVEFQKQQELDGKVIAELIQKLAKAEMKKGKAVLDAKHNKEFAMIANDFMEQDMLQFKEEIGGICEIIEEEHRLHVEEIKTLSGDIKEMREELNGFKHFRVDSQSFNDKERPHEGREPKISKVNDDHHVDNVGKVVNKDVEISIENSYLMGNNLLISEGDSASHNEEVELGRDDGQVDKAIPMGESQVKFSPNGENEVIFDICMVAIDEWDESDKELAMVPYSSINKDSYSRMEEEKQTNDCLENRHGLLEKIVYKEEFHPLIRAMPRQSSPFVSAKGEETIQWEGFSPSFPPSISITLYGVSMEISIEYLGYVFGSCVSRLGVDLFGDLVDDFSEMEWLLRWLFIDLDLEIHQGDYRRYLISLIECLSDDEGEESLLGSEDSGQVSMSDSELEIDCIALDDEEEIDEGVLLGLPRGLYRMLLPRDQGIVLYSQAQPYGNLPPVLPFGLANAPAHVRYILQ
ncbi:hypothetical protein L7F22_061865 [Adiantum nelumboides]|nr:hypothetical protein [Adiantum nelumboides]